MKSPLFKLTIAFTATLLSDEIATIKQKLKSNMIVKYSIMPDNANNISEMFSKGIFYGRLRSNNFFYDKENSNNNDYIISAVGGSLVYRSGYLNGFGFSGALYTSNVILNIGDVPFYNIKSAKDTFSRYNVANSKGYSMNTLGQFFMEYKKDKIDIKVGRFLIESQIARSNDSKMVPNTFEGILFKSRNLYDTKLQVAYLRKQKLRDHENFHHILAYGDLENRVSSKWRENDDSSMNRGIGLSELKEKDIKDRLILFDIKNNSIKNTTINFNYSIVPDLLSYSILELSHRIHFKKLSITPSFKIMYQFDNGAGEIANANLKGDTRGYKIKNSLDTSLIAYRLDLSNKPFRFRLGYSKIADKADFITPWRAFPTGGYTRAMGQTNWYANTSSYLFRTDLFATQDIKLTFKYAIEDFDDKKVATQSDSRVFTFDILKKNFLDLPNLYLKFRFANIQGSDNTVSTDGVIKNDPSYSEARLELNYLF